VITCDAATRAVTPSIGITRVTIIKPTLISPRRQDKSSSMKSRRTSSTENSDTVNSELINRSCLRISGICPELHPHALRLASDKQEREDNAYVLRPRRL